MEELFLRSFFVGKKLNIIDHQQVDAAVFIAELLLRPILDGIDEIIGERFAADIFYPCGWAQLQHLMADGVHQMGLA